MEEGEDDGLKLFCAVVVFRKTFIQANGKQEPMRSTTRLIVAKDTKQASEKLKKFWDEKMRSYSPLSMEINECIE